MNIADPVFSRRQLLVRSGGTLLAASEAGKVLARSSPRRTLRVIAYNVYECTGWPKDRALGKKATTMGQMVDRFANELALYEPDIINFSESPSEDVVNRIAERLGMHAVRFPSGGKWPGSLLSRFEIAAPRNAPVVGGQSSPELFTRHWGKAEIKLPGGEQLIVHSAHLHPSDQSVRVREITAMLASMKENLAGNRSMLLMGDLNHGPTPPEYPAWSRAGWTDTFAKVGQGEGLTIKSDTPQYRIDYVMAAGPIAGRIVESRPLFEGAFRVNNDDANSFALSDHLPQLAVFEIE
ncbi:MAG: endonuclease/exonuclease/phosphatase family protein [Pirellulaceae bacterium]